MKFIIFFFSFDSWVLKNVKILVLKEKKKIRKIMLDHIIDFFFFFFFSFNLWRPFLMINQDIN